MLSDPLPRALQQKAAPQEEDYEVDKDKLNDAVLQQMALIGYDIE